MKSGDIELEAFALADARPIDVIERATEAAREMLGMEVAYVSDTR